MGGSDCLCACATTFARYGSAALPGLGGSWRHHRPSRDLSTACSIGRSEGKVEDSFTFWRKKSSATSVLEEKWQFAGRIFWKLNFCSTFLQLARHPEHLPKPVGCKSCRKLEDSSYIEVCFLPSQCTVQIKGQWIDIAAFCKPASQFGLWNNFMISDTSDFHEFLAST